jgi:hypothetical protein
LAGPLKHSATQPLGNGLSKSASSSKFVTQSRDGAEEQGCAYEFARSLPVMISAQECADTCPATILYCTTRMACKGTNAAGFQEKAE